MFYWKFQRCILKIYFIVMYHIFRGSKQKILLRLRALDLKPGFLVLSQCRANSMGAGIAAVAGLENEASSCCAVIEEAQAELRYL
jgi:hypothetical protein